MESLEVRITPSTDFWLGADGADWTDPANWVDDIEPVAGDDLVFPATADNALSTNDFPAGTTFDSISIEASGYSLGGKSVKLSQGISTSYSSGTSTLAIDTDLLNGAVSVGSGGDLDLNGTISGAAGISKTGAGRLDLAGNNAYTGATTINAGIVMLSDSNAPGATSGVAIAAGAELDIGSGLTIGTPITSVEGTGTAGAGALVSLGGASSLTGDVTLAGGTAIGVAAGQLTLSGVIDDGGNNDDVTLVGGGTLVYTNANSYAGMTEVTAGTLELDSNDGPALAGPLTIDAGTGGSALVQAEAASQLTAITANVTLIGAGARFDLNGYNYVVDSLTFTGGTVTTGDGTLLLGMGGVTTAAASSTATISGNLDLATGTRTFTVARGTVPDGGPDLLISAIVIEGGITKAGSGTLELGGVDTFAAGATVAAGTLRATNDAALGTGTTTIAAGAELELSGGITVANDLSIAGTGVTTQGALVSIGGVNNTVAGNLTLAGAATLDAAAGSELTISGAIGDGGKGYGLTETGSGALILTGTSTYTGPTTVSGGTLEVDGNVDASGEIEVESGGFLGGCGTVGKVISTGGTVAPADAPNILTAGSISLDINSTFAVQLDGPTPGGADGYDQVVASGPISLGGAALSATPGGGYTPTPGDQLTIIQNNSRSAVGGTFGGLPEGAVLTLGAYDFRITYQGGTNGQDVVLTAVGATTTQLSTVPQAPSYGQSVTFTAAVSAASGTPSGSVAFYDGNPTDGGSLLGTATVDGSGHATFSTSALHVTGSPHQIYAVYDPSTATDFLASTSPALGQTIAPAPLTIAANNANKPYGNPLPSFTFSDTGFQNGDSAADFTIQPTAVTTATAASHVNLNGYAITPSGAVDPDYTFTYVSGTLTVTPVILTVVANDASKPYGAPVPFLTANVSGFINGDTVASLAAQPTLSTTATQSSPIITGGYAITPSGAVDADYNFQYIDGTLTITPAPLTVTANDLTMTYGGTVPSLTYTIHGFVNDDTASVVSGTPPLDTTATGASPAGAYAITVDVSGLSATNYTFAGQSGSLTINPAALDVTANGRSMAYGGTVPSLTFVVAGLVNGDTQGPVLSGALATNASSSSDVGGYAITQGTLASISSNYTLDFIPGTLTINPAPIDVTANDRSMTYGGAVPALSYGVTGLVNGDTPGSVLTGALTTAASPSSDAGEYGISRGSLISNSNYTIATFTSGTLTINPAPLAVTANDRSMTYGGAVPALTFVATGLVDGDTQGSALSGALETTGTSSSTVGAFPIVQGTLASNGNYTIRFTPGTLTIDPATLDVTANNLSMTYGGIVPVLTLSVSGLLNGDTQGSILTGRLIATGTSSSAAGVYPITRGTLEASSSDYTLDFTTGTLTIHPAALVVTANNPSMTYGRAVPALTFAVAGLVNGDTPGSVLAGTLATAGTSSSGVGVYPIVQGTLASNGNYTITTFTPGTLTINPAPLAVTANDQATTYGGAVPALTFSVTGLVNGDTQGSVLSGALGTTGSSSSNVGDYPIAQGTLAVDSNYTLTFTPGTLTINPAPLEVTANNQSMTYGGNVPAFTFIASGLVNGDAQGSVLSGTLVATGTSTSNTGRYSITQGNLSANGNYTLTFTPGTLTISPAVLDVTANDRAMTYGGTVPSLTFAVSGLVNSDAEGSVLSGALTTTGTSSSEVGVYPVVRGTLTSNSNYVVNFAPATLTIDPAALEVRANDPSMTYGGTMPPLTFVVVGLVNGDTPGSVLSGALTTTGTSSSEVGVYPITQGTLTADGDYTLTFAPGTFTVNPAALEVTANDQSMTYGGAAPALTFGVTGLVNGDSSGAVLSGALVTIASSSSDVGGYAIAQGTLTSNSNYTVRFTPGTLTIDPATLEVRANGQSMTYGGAVPSLSFVVTGLVNGDAQSSALTGQLTTMGTSTSDVGVYPITRGTLEAISSDYALDFTPGTLLINPAPLEVSANDQSMTYGEAVPALTFVATGLVNGDTPGSVLAGSLATAGSSSSGVGEYGISEGSLISNHNYTIATFTPATLTINPAALEVRASDQSMTYGGAIAALTFSITGLVDGDMQSSVLSGELTTSGTSGSNVGDYPIAQGTLASNSNYIINFTAGTLTINPAVLDVGADDQSMTYGGGVPSLTFVVTGLVNGDAQGSVLSGGLTTTGTPRTDVGGYPISQGTLAVDSNYIINFTPATLTINPAALDITANDQSMTYGGAVPALTFSITGLVNGDTPGSVLAGSLATTASSSSDVGGHPITQGTLSPDRDYIIAMFTPATLTINPAALEVTANDLSMTYGGSLPTLTFVVAGLVNGDAQGSVLSSVLATAGASSSNVGAYPITQGTLASNSNYTIRFTPGTLTIDPAPLEVTANVLSMTYGGAVPALTFAATGLVNGDTQASVFTGALTTAASPSSDAGEYGISRGSLISNSNYTIATFTSGTLTIDPAPLAVTANDRSMTYGGAVPALTFVATGLVDGDTQGSALSGDLETTGTSSATVGDYTIAQGALSSNGNYTIRFTPGTLTIDPAALDVTANDLSMTYGGIVPSLTFVVSGLVNGDAQSSALTGRLTTAGTSSSAAGVYSITRGTLEASSSDYTLDFTPATLTIHPAALVATAKDESMTYGGAVPALTFVATGLVNGDTPGSVLAGTLATAGTSSTGVGDYPIAQGTLASNSNYTVRFTSGTLTINPAVLEVRADDQSMTYGGTVPALTFAVTGLVNGDAPGSVLTGALATAASSTSDVGGYSISQGSLTAGTNYSLSFTPGTLTINPASLTITANAESTVFGAPLPVLTARYSGFVNGDTAASLTTRPTLSTTATSTSPVGSYPIRVSGARSANYTITLQSGTLTVGQVSPSSDWVPSSGSSVFGQMVSFTIHVGATSPSTAVPSGTVTFFVDGVGIGSTAIDSDGQATFSTTSLEVGAHTVTASYSGSSNFVPGSFGSVQQVVAQSATESVLTATAVRNRRGRTIAVNWTSQVLVVSPGGGTPTGTVTDFIGGRPLAARPLGNGIAILTLKPKQALKKTLSFTYSGDADFLGSTSPKLVVNNQSLKASARPFSAFFSRGREQTRPATPLRNRFLGIPDFPIPNHKRGR